MWYDLAIYLAHANEEIVAWPWMDDQNNSMENRC